LRTHVFEPFFTTKETGKGSGLGLSMVYGFAKQSKGHVTIYSEEGEGTTVRLYLPRYYGSVETVTPPAPSEDLPPASGEIVLVVEDDADLRTLVVTVLSSLGYRILEAGSAPSALKLLNGSSGVNLLLTDVVLPGGMNGVTLAEEVQRRRLCSAVLYMSGYTENSILRNGRFNSALNLLQKPFHIQQLASRVRATLDTKSE
jgi:CheY-like chemotaxis protein